jgi:hypothetical protein
VAYERVGAVVSTGTLAALISLIKIATRADFASEGSLQAEAVEAIRFRDATLASAGILWAEHLYLMQNAGVANLSSEGTLLADIGGDGLSAVWHIPDAPEFQAAFHSEGSLSATEADGLAATAGEFMQTSEAGGGEGTLSVLAFAQYLVTLALAGAGTLSATATPISGGVSASLSGAGSLSGMAYPEGIVGVPLAGSGALTAAVQLLNMAVHGDFSGAGALSAFISRAAQLSGAGSLNALVAVLTSALANLASDGVLFATAINATDGLSASATQQYQEPESQGGVGTISALWKQIYTLAPSFASSGALVASAYEYVIGGPEQLSGAGTLGATAYQYKTASVSFNGAGSLAGAAFAQYNAQGDMSGDGSLSAVAYASVQFVAVGSEFVSTSTKTTSGSLTIATIANDYVIVDLSGETSSAESPITVSGITVTQLAVQPYNNNSSNASLRRYGFRSNGGTKTINYSGSFPNDVEIQAVAYRNVVNVGTTTTTYGASGATSASQNTSSGTGQIVVQSFGSDQSSGQFSPSGGTSRWNGKSTTSGSNYLTPLEISDDGGATTTFSVSATNCGNWSGIATVLSAV